jgi:hypothetical protein
VPVLVTPQLTAGLGVLVDSTKFGRVHVREPIGVRVGFSGDDFTRNIVRYVAGGAHRAGRRALERSVRDHRAARVMITLTVLAPFKVAHRGQTYRPARPPTCLIRSPSDGSSWAGPRQRTSAAASNTDLPQLNSRSGQLVDEAVAEARSCQVISPSSGLPLPLPDQPPERPGQTDSARRARRQSQHSCVGCWTRGPSGVSFMLG